MCIFKFFGKTLQIPLKCQFCSFYEYRCFKKDFPSYHTIVVVFRFLVFMGTKCIISTPSTKLEIVFLSHVVGMLVDRLVDRLFVELTFFKRVKI